MNMQYKGSKIVSIMLVLLVVSMPISYSIALSGPAVSTTPYSATVTWETDVPGSSFVSYGTDQSLGSSAQASGQRSTHSVNLTGLESATTYYYQPQSCDSQGECSQGSVSTFTTDTDTEPPTIDVVLPEAFNSNRLDIEGATEPFSDVRIFVEEELKRRVTADSSGVFALNNVAMDTSKPSNMIRIAVIDKAGFQSSLERSVELDLQPPIMNITPLDAYTQDDSIVIEGDVNEEVTLAVSVVSGSTESSVPAAVNGLHLVEQEDNSAELQWDPLEEENIRGYLIYRDGKLLTSYSDTVFVDAVLNRNTSYAYEIAAFDEQCRIGPKSPALTVVTSSSGAELTDTFEELTDYCTLDETYEETRITGRFSRSVQLEEGKNLVTINATDKAGNSVISKQEIILDTDVPQILEHNLGDLTPAYILDVTVRGKVSKQEDQQILVKVTINDDKSYTDFAKADGSFEIPIELERKVESEFDTQTDYDPQRSESNYYSSFGASWDNEITLTASSSSGLTSEPVTEFVSLATCGYGSWYSVRLGEPTPEILTPRLALEGLAQIGIPVLDIKWQGGTVRNGSISHVSVSSDVPLNERDKNRYDLDFVQDVQYIDNIERDKGYVLITLKKLDSGDFVTELEDDTLEEDITTLRMENLLSDHRINDDCKVPGFGCVRIPLMMEIDFNYYRTDDQRISTSNPRLARSRQEIELRNQRQCWDVEIAIDRRVPTDQIPEEFLVSTIDVLNTTIDAINSLLTPLNTVKQVLFYGCAGSILLDFGMAFKESYACEFSSTIGKIGSGEEGEWDPYFARVGQCENQYSDDDEARSSCQSCEDAVRSRNNFHKTMDMLCDRIFCPSAPTFQKYVRDNSQGSSVAEANADFKIVSDCAYGKENYQQAILYGDEDSGVYKAYEDYLEQKELVGSEDDENKCGDLHIPNNECCGYEYMQEWNSACLFFDELKESKFLAMDNQGLDLTEDRHYNGAGRVYEQVAGLSCTEDGGTSQPIIPAYDSFTNPEILQKIPNSYSRGPQDAFIAGSGSSVWFRFLPKSARSSRSENNAHIHHAEVGFVGNEIENAQFEYERGESSKIATERVFQPADNTLFEIDVTSIDPTSQKYNDDARDNFVRQYDRVVNAKSIDPKKAGSGSVKAKEVYLRLQEALGVVDKDYIVDPTSGILRAFQCGCLPGITSYLNLWKRVLEAIKVCLQTVLNTGDGSAGMCQAVLSVYVCDLVYDLISCFQKKYGAGEKRDTGSGIGNFLGALTSAGGSVSSRINGRYSESSVYRAIFAEKKLVHSACLWAFTGTWDFEVTAVLEEDVSIDVETVAAVYPCTRRFVSFNPTTVPEGKTTYNYHIGMGMVAGSQIRYWLELVCSDDYSCDTPTGQCDCAGPNGKQTLLITPGTGQAARGATIEEEILQNVRDSNVRYDKAILSWETTSDTYETTNIPKSGSVECRINEKGGSAPAFCQLDAAEGAFRCELGFDEANYVRFFNDPVSVSSEYYAGDEPVNVDVRLSQRQPSEVQAGREINEYTKFLHMKLFNQQGVEVHASQYYPLNGDGVHEFSNLPNYRIQESDFRRTNPSISATGRLVKRIRLTDRGVGPSHNDMHIEFTSPQRYNIFYYKGANSERVDIVTDGQVRNYNNAYYIFDSANDDTKATYLIELREEPTTDDTIRVTYKGVSASSGQCTDEPQRWRMEISLYEKSPTAEEPSGQLSTYEGEPQQRDVEIIARCQRPSESLLIPCTPDNKVVDSCSCDGAICNPVSGENIHCFSNPADPTNPNKYLCKKPDSCAKNNEVTGSCLCGANLCKPQTGKAIFCNEDSANSTIVTCEEGAVAAAS